MQRVLLTGMSATGKSTLVAEFVDRGYRGVDTDDGWCEPDVDGRQRWNEERMQALLAEEGDGVLFVAGCEENQAKFHPQFDHVVLLSAPEAVLLERLAKRTNNPYGKTPEDIERVLGDLATVEPLLRRIADAEVDTSRPLSEVADAVLALVHGEGRARV